MTASRNWMVLLIGGASGVGKTALAHRLAGRFKVSVLQIDDVQTALERLTTPAQQPELHFWRTNWAEFSAFTDSQLVEHYVSIARGVFEPALEAVIAQHLEARLPVIIEGDFLTPQLASAPAFEGEPSNGRVTSLFVYEDEAQISVNYGGREGDGQTFRSHASWVNGQWLRSECARLDVAELPARPWDSAVQRAVTLLDLDGVD